MANTRQGEGITMHGIGALIVIVIVAAVFMPLLEGKRSTKRLAQRRPAAGHEVISPRLSRPASGHHILRVRAKPLMTDYEIIFWRRLLFAARPLHVAPQVAMGALLTVEGEEGCGARRVIASIVKESTSS